MFNFADEISTRNGGKVLFNNYWIRLHDSDNYQGQSKPKAQVDNTN